jgi:hypothetical protein
MDTDVDDYQLYVEQSRRRFRTIVVCLMIGLVATIYVPWALASTRTLSSGVAAATSVIAGIVFLGAWQGLLTRLSDPYDSTEPTAASRGATLHALLFTAGAILALLVATAFAFYLVGFIQAEGLVGTGMLVFLLGGSLVRTLFFRALRSGLSA